MSTRTGASAPPTVRQWRHAPYLRFVARRPASVTPAILSSVVHVLLGAGLVLGAGHVAASGRVPSFVTVALRYLLPPLPKPSAIGERILFVAPGAQSAPGVVTRSADRIATGRLVAAPPPGVDAGRAGNNAPPAVASTEEAAAEEHAFTFQEVDSIAIRDPQSVGPEYPQELRLRGIEGFATMRFVVDSTGLIDLESVTVLAASRQEFAKAVRDAMPRMKFRPARQGATAVRQLSEQSFHFRMQPAADNAARAGPVKKPQ